MTNLLFAACLYDANSAASLAVSIDESTIFVSVCPLSGFLLLSHAVKPAIRAKPSNMPEATFSLIFSLPLFTTNLYFLYSYTKNMDKQISLLRTQE